MIITVARIFYSALVSGIRGALSGSVFASTRGTRYLKRRNSSPTDKRSCGQVRIRRQISDLAGRWYSLSHSRKRLWCAYATAAPTPMSGINAFIGVNNRLIYYLGPSAYRAEPPPTPSAPGWLRNTVVIAVASMDYCVMWGQPDTNGVFVIAQYRPVFGIERAGSQQWKFGGTAAGDALSIRINTDYPNTYTLKFRVRSIDLFGRASPWSHVHTRTPVYAGRYGYSAYAYSWFGI